MLDFRVTGLQHLGVPVIDIARSKAFYTRLGFHEAMVTTLHTESGDVQVAMMKTGAIVIELYQLPNNALVEISTRGHGHIDHIALDVHDIQHVFDTLKAAGLVPLENAPIFLPLWDKGVYYFNIEGPDGEKVEFNQRVT